MFERWRGLSFLLVGLLVPSFAFADGSFENTAIVRTVELGGSLVHVTTTYAAKALKPNSKVYVVSLGSQEHERTSYLEAKLKGEREPLSVEALGYETASNTHLIGVELPKSLGLNETINLVLETVQTHATYPWPQQASQSEEQSLKYETDLLILSPYHTTVQRTKFRSPSPKILSYSQPEGLDDFTLENPVTKSGATITYGPYNNIAPTSAEFINEHQKLITIHYNYENPVMEVSKLKRSAEISHWGANLNIQDEIHLRNVGPALKGHFSRLEHQSQNFHHRSAPHVLTAFALHLPAGIHNTYYYDLIGNVSTSHLRVATAPSKRSSVQQYSVLELKPRYPIMGGWNYSFTLGWDAPLADSASWDATINKYIVGVPVMTPIPGTVVNEAEVMIILPEGATDIQFFPPFPALVNSLSTHVTYLDTTGRPALTFEYKDLTVKHAGVIYVTYKVPFSAHLKKPFAVATAFIGLFMIAVGARRVDLRLHKK